MHIITANQTWNVAIQTLFGMLYFHLITTGFLLPIIWIDGIFATSSAIQYRLRYAITENQPEDLRIGKLDDDLAQTPEVRSAELFSLFHSSNHGALRYKLRDPSIHFNLDEKTSIFSTRKSIDLESLCPRYCRESSTRAQLNQVVNVWYEQRLIALVHVEVTVIDVDDNPPRFPATIPRPYVLQLKEVIYRVGQQVELPKALDNDVQPDHAEIAYRLESFPNDQTNALEVFHLIAQNDSRLLLVLQRDLDYEDVKSYRFYLIAWSPRFGDQSRKPFQTGTPEEFQDKLEIRVDVLNINDISPVFSKSLYTAQVSEATKVGSVVYKFEATDGDENSTIRYTMEDPLDPDITRIFQLNENGEVKLRGKLDYEKRNEYAFSVRASDGEFFALTRLQLTVVDVNDELPEFVTNPANLTVQENEVPETFVGQLLITDRDSPEVNGHVRCQEPAHLAGKQPLLFHLQSSQSSDLVLNAVGRLPLAPSVTHADERVYQRFDVYSRHSFDRETEPQVHESLLVCSDGQSIEAIDYTQYIEVERPRLTGTLTISLTVTDQNDNAPVFERQFYEAELRENVVRGTRVIQVHAADADSDPYARPQYRLLHNELFSSHFDVEPETGWIVTHADIDREAQSVYQLTVLAVDGWRNDSDRPSRAGTRTQHTASTRVQIRVLDENDNAPEFRGPRQFAVEENQPTNIWVADLQVMDRDEGLNKEVEFSFVSPSKSAASADMRAIHSESNNTLFVQGNMPFRLTTNGSLYTTDKLDRENQSHYCFEVTVKDRAPVNPLSSTDTICVRVLDLNDNAPRFTRIKGSLPVTAMHENRTGIDSTVQTIPFVDLNTDVMEIVVPISVHEVPGYCALIAEAEDADEGRNALLRYDIKSMGTENEVSPISSAFMVDPLSGRMMLARHINMEEIGTHPITITVADSGLPSHHAELTVQLQVEDSPARGNWLLPDAELARRGSSNNKGDYSEAHTILIVIVLSGISAFLAAVLISAILCMIKPCRGGRARSRGTTGFTKGSGSESAGKYGPDRIIEGKHPGTYADYNLSILDMNGYAGGVDTTSQGRVSHLTAAQIPGLDQLYLPSDKLIGVEPSFQTCSSIVEDTSWTGRSSVPTIINSQPLDRLSPPVPLCDYPIPQPIESNWIDSTQTQPSMWTTTALVSNTSTSCRTHRDSLVQPTSPLRSVYLSQNSTDTHSTINVVAPFQMTQFLPSLLPDRGRRDCAEYDGSELNVPHSRPCFTNRIVALSNEANRESTPESPAGCERQLIGEEQRSDSGRGASDEEITNQFVPNKLFNGHQGKFRSATLRSSQENTSHMMSGLIFPSLPRISSANRVGSSTANSLTTFDSTRTTRNSVVGENADTDVSTTKVAMIRFPKSHVV